MEEDLWLGCCLGFRIAKNQQNQKVSLSDLIEALKALRDGDTVLTDPGQDAANSPEEWKSIHQSIGHAANRGDREMAKRALEQLANQKDE